MYNFKVMLVQTFTQTSFASLSVYHPSRGANWFALNHIIIYSCARVV